jgi:hypothetical protein
MPRRRGPDGVGMAVVVDVHMSVDLVNVAVYEHVHVVAR